jgi:hypothetical protein
MKNIFWLALVALVAGGILGFTVLSFRSLAPNTIAETSWKTNLQIGMSSESVFQKALRTKVGVFALPKEEVVYFMVDKDDEGNSLNADDKYEITGVAPNTKIWSITLYNNQYRLVQNSIGRYHFNATTLQVGQGEAYSFTVSREKSIGNWLPAPEQGGFVLCYRVYQPPALFFPIQPRSLPRIRKL